MTIHPDAEAMIEQYREACVYADLEMPEGFTAFVVYDHDADSPREGNISRMSHNERDIANWNESDDLDAIVRNIVRQAWEEECWKDLNVVAVESFDFGGRGEYTGIGVVFREDGDKHKLYTNDPDAILERNEDVWGPAKALLHAEIEQYVAWSKGEVYGLIVIDHRNGNWHGLWGIYDDPWTKNGEAYYVHQVAPDLIADLVYDFDRTEVVA